MPLVSSLTHSLTHSHCGTYLLLTSLHSQWRHPRVHCRVDRCPVVQRVPQVLGLPQQHSLTHSLGGMVVLVRRSCNGWNDPITLHHAPLIHSLTHSLTVQVHRSVTIWSLTCHLSHSLTHSFTHSHERCQRPSCLCPREYSLTPLTLREKILCYPLVT